ncbi:MAG: SCO family protein [Dehalococcoidia bacterium]|nr:SCO family protein [Dehalococcoidia bacterium]
MSNGRWKASRGPSDRSDLVKPQIERPPFFLVTVWQAAVVIFSLILAGCSTGGGDAEFSGTVIEDRREAQDFRLTDQFGRPVSLGQLNEDRVVVLTFLYTYCPDICPIVAHHVKAMSERLGDDAAEVSIVVVSVDSQRDTVERALEYSEAWGMAENWEYLVGGEEDLSPVWEAYYVVAAVDEEGRVADVPEEWKVDRVRGVDALSRDIASRYTVTHQAPVYLIDRQGRVRVLHTLPIDPEEVVGDVRALLGEDG